MTDAPGGAGMTRAGILVAYGALEGVLMTPVQGHALVEIVNFAAAAAASEDVVN